MNVHLRLRDGRLFEAIDVQIFKANNPKGTTTNTPGFDPLIVTVDSRVGKFDHERSSRPNPLPAAPFET